MVNFFGLILNFKYSAIVSYLILKIEQWLRWAQARSGMLAFDGEWKTLKENPIN